LNTFRLRSSTVEIQIYALCILPANGIDERVTSEPPHHSYFTTKTCSGALPSAVDVGMPFSEELLRTFIAMDDRKMPRSSDSFMLQLRVEGESEDAYKMVKKIRVQICSDMLNCA